MLPYLLASEDDPSLYSQAKALSSYLNLPLISTQNLPKEGYIFWVTKERLFLEYRHGNLKHHLSAEFLSGKVLYRLKKGGGYQEMLAKAVGLKKGAENYTILDGTAGLGKDAFILAMLGAKLCLVERSKIIYTLLKDGILRAEKSELFKEKIKENIHLVQGELTEILDHLKKEDTPQVIYLDPMFPESRKTALTKMEMRIIRDIVGRYEEGDKMLTKSLCVAKKRVVVKRALHAPHLEGVKPDFIVAGKRNRYDVYLTGGSIKIHE